MEDVIYDSILESIGHDVFIDVGKFQDLLEENGFMVVPIEDPTNLRFGVEWGNW